MIEKFWVIIIIYSLVCAELSSFLGMQKNRSGTNWFWCGFLFGVLGLITAVGVPSKEIGNNIKTPVKEDTNNDELNINETTPHFKCADCGYRFSLNMTIKEINGKAYCGICAKKYENKNS